MVCCEARHGGRASSAALRRWALGASLGVLLTSASAGATRPTPHQRIDAALAPLRTALEALALEEAERAAVADLQQQGEAFAASQVEAEVRGATGEASAFARRIELLARVARGRVEAQRAEAQASAAARAALEADERVALARAALERATERRLEVEREQQAAQEAPEPAPAASAAPTTGGAGAAGSRTPRAPARPAGRAR